MFSVGNPDAVTPSESVNPSLGRGTVYAHLLVPVRSSAPPRIFIV